MKSKIIVVQSILILALLIIIGVLSIQNGKNSKAEVLYLEYGDTFSAIEIYGTTGEKVDKLAPDQSKKATVVFYVTDECSGCIGAMADFKRFESVFGEDLNYIFLWEDGIPQNLIKKYEINATSYTLKGKTKISTSTPTFYIVSNDDTIVFRDVDFSNHIQKIIDLNLVEKESTQKNATQYIVNSYFQSVSSKDPKLVYFYMPGCSDCQAADELIKADKLDEKFEIVYIYKYDSKEDGVVIDKNKLFAKVYGINWYPSFLLISDTNCEFVGEANQEKLKAILEGF